MTRSDLVEIIARAICAEHCVDPDEIGYKGRSQWVRRIDDAQAILSALSASGLAIVPREATKEMVEAGCLGDPFGCDVGGADKKTVYSPVWLFMVTAGDLAQ